MLRSIISALMTLGAGSAAMSFAQDAAPEAPIRAIVAEQVSAWNGGDGQACARHLAPDASFTILFGMVMYGAPAFAGRHTEILATLYKGTTKHNDIRAFASLRLTSRWSISTTRCAA